MGKKYLELRQEAEALAEFSKLPSTISHGKLIGFSSEGKEFWEYPSRMWSLKLEAVSGTGWIMHKNNTGKYRIAYVLTSWEGEEQALPFGEDELKEMKKSEPPYSVFSGGIYGDDIKEIIWKMKKWIEEENNKTQAK